MTYLDLYDAYGIDFERLAPQAALAEFHILRSSSVKHLCGALVKHPNLRHVLLAATNLSDDELAALADCKRLRTITVSSTNVSGRAFAEMNSWPEITIVNIYPARVTDETLTYIARLPALQVLYAPQNELTMDAVAEAPWSKTIEEIDVDCDAKPETRHLAAFAKLPHLRSLRISTTEYIDQVKAIRSAAPKAATE